MVLTSGNKSKPEARYTQSLCLQTKFTDKILQGPFFKKPYFPMILPVTSHLEVQALIEENGCKSNQLSTAFQEKQSLASRRGPK